jgi:hypothetical protein
VDFKSGYEDRPEWKKEIGRFRNIKPPECSSEETYEPACSIKACESCSTAIYSDEQIDIKRCEAFKKSNPLEKVDGDEIDSLKDDHLILLSRHLLAYGLRSKQWRKFRWDRFRKQSWERLTADFIDADDYQKMDTNEEKRESGFNNLMIPHGYKELLKAMVKN